MVLSSAAQQELENLGYVTKYGSCTWAPSTILGIIKNEKYKGDLLLGKTFTVEPISKQRLDNMGKKTSFTFMNIMSRLSVRKSLKKHRKF